MTPTTDLPEKLVQIRNSPEKIAAAASGIYDAMLRESPHIREGNFTSIGTDDLQFLFRRCDEQFFDGLLSRTISGRGSMPITFRLSRTMTSAGGKMIHTRIPQPGGTFRSGYEIAVASRMLFMSFSDVQRPVTVAGLDCPDRLHALQRIMEHEIIHLAETLVWGKSSCSAPPFKALARNIFGHTDTRHALVTPRERAAVQHEIVIGTRVEFEFEGIRRAGRVNRINSRATVLVESDHGTLYGDGKRYLKFYVPLPLLRKTDAPK